MNTIELGGTVWEMSYPWNDTAVQVIDEWIWLAQRPGMQCAYLLTDN